MRNIQKEKKDFFRGSPAAILTSAGATSLEETARLPFFFFAMCGLNMHPGVKKCHEWSLTFWRNDSRLRILTIKIGLLGDFDKIALL